MNRLPDQIATLINAAAATYGVDAALARAVAWIESRGNTFATSDKGAKGIFQLMPETAKALGVTDVTEPAQNIDGGVRYLASLVKRFGESNGVLAFNWGPKRTSDYLAGKLKGVTQVPQQLRTYVANVFERAALERGEGNRAAAPPKSSESSPLLVDCPSCGHSFDARKVAAAERGVS